MKNCKRKKILIVNNNLEMGGIQRSLVNLVKEVYREYDITLLLFSKQGALLKEIPEEVTVMTPIKAYCVLGLDKNTLKKYPVYFLLKTMFLIWAKIFSRRSAMKLLGVFQKKINGYDMVISYSHLPHHKYFGNGCAEFVLDKIECENKVCFLHCDYLNFGGKTEVNNKAYREFNKIACCSDSVKERFLLGSKLPGTKVHTVKNFYDLSLCAYQTEEEKIFDENFINILIIARLSEEKGILRAVEALYQSKRTDIRCYIVGDGPQKEKIRNTISKYQMDGSVRMLGEQREPYKYLNQADWLLVPSFHEAAPMVFDEAMLMGTKVVTTNTTSAEEMVGSERGIVCENSIEGIIHTLKNIKKTKKNAEQKFDNEKQRKQFAELFRV